MFGRFFKNKEDGKSGPPGHQRNGNNMEPPAGGGFFNLPPPVSQPYTVQNPAVSGVSSSSTSKGNAAAAIAGAGYSIPSTYSNSNAPLDNKSMGGNMDMFGGMSVKAPLASTGIVAAATGGGAIGGSNGIGRYPSQLARQQQQYGGYTGATQLPNAMQLPKANGTLFSGLEIAAGTVAPAMHEDGGGVAKLAYANNEARKLTRPTGSFNYQDVPGSKNTDALSTLQYSRTSAVSSTSTTTSRSSSKSVKKKKKKTFRPGFGRQLSDESVAALQRGDLKEDDIICQREGRLLSDRSESSRSSHSVTGPTDLAHLLPPVKPGSVLQGLTVHKGSATSGGGVLAGFTVHKPPSPLPSPAKVAGSSVSGLNIHTTRQRSIADEDVKEVVYDAPAEENAPEVYKKSSSPVPAAPPTPEERLFNTLRDFHESAVSFCRLTVKQNEEENRLMERKAQLANQLTQYEMDLRDVEAQQHRACEVEDFEKADALNTTINSVRHCITLTESDVRKLDSELVAFVKAKEKAFANQLKSTRGTLQELEKFREDQESERTVVRNEYKLYEANQTEQLQFEAERIDTEMHHVSVSLENVISEKAEIEATIEGQCSSEFAVQKQLMEEKQAFEEEVRELERRLKEKRMRVQKIQSSIDTAQRDINTVRNRYSRQLKRIADRENGIKKTKAEVESDGKHLEQQRLDFDDKLKQYMEDIVTVGKRISAVKKEMRAASLLANVLEVQETRREQSLVRKRQQTAELSSLNDAAAIAEQSFTMLTSQREELEKSLSIHRNAIASAEAMIPRLEQEKKAAAAQRNFKEAARISKDIKALEKDRMTAEENVEVVELELQDLKDRVDKREVEFDEKRKELREMEKHLELATLQELWKEAKHLRKALRKIEKCMSEGAAANGGIDFRSSALLLVQAEYDACIYQVETLEKKYDVTDSVESDDDKDDDDDDESVDDEEKEGSGHVSLSRTSLVGKTTHTEGLDIDGKATENSSIALEEIVAQLHELESRIEKATENEEYELAARLDAKIESLKQRKQSIKASIPQEVFTPSQDVHESLEDEELSSRKCSGGEEEVEADVEYAHKEMVSPVSVLRSHDDMRHSLETTQLRVGMLEDQIELATENEDYEIAASYSEELQALREKVKRIRGQLDSSDGSSGVTVPTMFGGRDCKTDNLTSVESAMSSAPLDLAQETLVESKTSESMFGGLRMSGSPDVTSHCSSEVQITESDLEVETGAVKLKAVTAVAKADIFSPTSSNLKDSFFGNPGVPNNSTSMVEPFPSGSLFGTLQMTGSFPDSTASFSSRENKTEEGKSDEHVSDTAVIEDVDLSVSAPVERGCMFSGLQPGSSAIDFGASAQTESVSVATQDSADMFGGLQLSSSAVAETTSATVDPASTNASRDIFGGLDVSSSSVSAASVKHSSTGTSTNIFGDLKLSSSAASASSEAPTDVFGGPEVSSISIAAVPVETNVDVASSPTEETNAFAKGVGDTRMSIHELREHTEKGNVVGAHHDASFRLDVPASTSPIVLSETSSTEKRFISTTTVTEVSGNGRRQAEFEQVATQS